MRVHLVLMSAKIRTYVPLSVLVPHYVHSVLNLRVQDSLLIALYLNEQSYIIRSSVDSAHDGQRPTLLNVPNYHEIRVHTQLYVYSLEINQADS